MARVSALPNRYDRGEQDGKQSRDPLDVCLEGADRRDQGFNMASKYLLATSLTTVTPLYSTIQSHSISCSSTDSLAIIQSTLEEMKGLYIFAAMVVSTCGALHGSHAEQGHASIPHRPHHLNKRSMRSSQPGGISNGPGNDPGREAAFSLGSHNYDQFIGNSTAAAAAGGQAGLASLWAGFLPSEGNPYGLFYAGNGRGSVTRGKANLGISGPLGDLVNAILTPLRAPLNDQGRAIIHILGQVGISL